jgi:DMSO reductase anchor subunit
LLSIATVYATAMIYRSLGTIAAWHTSWVPVVYVVFSLMSGFVFCAAYLNSVTESSSLLPMIALCFVVLAAIIKLFYWKHIQQSTPDSTIDTALGLKNTKEVAQFTAPHTQDNYLLDEMGYQIARNHANKLRQFCMAAGFGLSVLFLLPYFFQSGMLVEISLWLSVLAMMLGVLVERWLFFAEAKHTVTLYYGR